MRVSMPLFCWTQHWVLQLWECAKPASSRLTSLFCWTWTTLQALWQCFHLSFSASDPPFWFCSSLWSALSLPPYVCCSYRRRAWRNRWCTQAFQSSMTARIERIWVAMFFCLGLGCYMESSISYLDPTAFGRKGSLISSGVVKFVCGLLLTTISIGLYYCRTNQSTHGEYFRAKMLGKMTQPSLIQSSV